MIIKTAGRTDIQEFFRLSGNLHARKLTHHPFLAFCEVEGGIEVRIVDNTKALLELPDHTPVMAQWGGQWRSDFFHFTVGDVRRYLTPKCEADQQPV